MTQPEFATAMAVLTAAIGKPMATDQARVYFDLLKDLPLELLQAAVRKVLCEHSISTIPTIAELRKVATEIMQSPEASLDAGEAFRLAREAVRRFGYVQPAEGLASLSWPVRNVVRQIGWDAFCESENPEALRAHFFKAWEQAKASKVKRDNLPPALNGTINELRKIAQAKPMKGISDGEAR